jgi:hypothetical protein
MFYVEHKELSRAAKRWYVLATDFTCHLYGSDSTTSFRYSCTMQSPSSVGERSLLVVAIVDVMLLLVS